MSKVLLKVAKGGFIPANKSANDMLQSLKLKIGDDVLVDVKKPRNPQFFRLAHALGQMVIENIEGFENFTNYHDALKRIQREAKWKRSGTYAPCERSSSSDLFTSSVRTHPS